MKLENQVCTLQQAKQLKELGVRQDIGIALWYNHYKAGIIPIFRVGELNMEQYAAFTVAELGNVCVDFDLRMGKAKGQDWLWVHEIYMSSNQFHTQAEALCDFLIYLINNGTITVDEVNKRLEDA